MVFRSAKQFTQKVHMVTQFFEAEDPMTCSSGGHKNRPKNQDRKIIMKNLMNNDQSIYNTLLILHTTFHRNWPQIYRPKAIKLSFVRPKDN